MEYRYPKFIKHAKPMLIVISVILCSCETLQPQSIVLGWHGRYCGPRVPWSLSGDSLVAPLDEIDKICMEHDFCYEDLGYHDKYCDKDMVRKIDSLLENKKSTELCMGLARTIRSIIATKVNPSVRTSIVGSLSVLLSNPLMRYAEGQEGRFLPEVGEACEFK
uniref:Phospholipase A2 n=1 Tax=Candidatus Kentrum sp. LPFa TaxID=2126335 RepID=A0A450WGM1_9GAMM|nr:MAG: hypothetical protein BECKLPF1236B_GA0070989_10912 [Candidatus Kentron sp. LPFa]